MFRNKNDHTGSPQGNSGQSTVEYIILVAAVIAVMIVLIAGKNSIFSNRVSNTFNMATKDMVDKSVTLSESHHPNAGAPKPPPIIPDPIRVNPGTDT